MKKTGLLGHNLLGGHKQKLPVNLRFGFHRGGWAHPIKGRELLSNLAMSIPVGKRMGREDNLARLATPKKGVG